MRIGVIAAMRKELEALKEGLNNLTGRHTGIFDYHVGKIDDNEIIVMQSGIGKVNAAIGTASLINEFNPDLIISSGVAGGCDPVKADVMEIVVSTETLYHDVDCGTDNEPGQVQGLPPRFQGDEAILKIVSEFQLTDNPIRPGLIVSGDKFVSRKEDSDKIRADFPDAFAVDMESAAIAQTCYLYGRRFISIRIISDIPGVENHYAAYSDFWDQMAAKSFAATRELLAAVIREQC